VGSLASTKYKTGCTTVEEEEEGKEGKGEGEGGGERGRGKGGGGGGCGGDGGGGEEEEEKVYLPFINSHNTNVSNYISHIIAHNCEKKLAKNGIIEARLIARSATDK